MSFITVPFSWLLRSLYLLVGNYGFALILFTLVVKLILLPFGMKSKRSMMKTSRLTPKTKELEAKYKGDPQKYQAEVSKMYKEEGVNPMSGCLWSFLPLPILFALYAVIRQPLTNLMGLSAEQVELVASKLTELGVQAIETTGAYSEITLASHVHQFIDQIRAVVPEIIDIDFSFFGLDLSQVPQWNFWFNSEFYQLGGAVIWGTVGLFLIPVLSGALSYLSMFISNKMNNSVITDDKGKADQDAAASAAKQMKAMTYMMPLVSVYIGFIMPAGICIYWIASSVFSIIQDIVLTKYYRKIYDAEDAEKARIAAEKEAIEAEKAARREEQRRLNPEAVNPNVSKKKKKAQQKAQTVKAPEGKLTHEQREALRQERETRNEDVPSGDPDRPYAKGRTYKADRYAGVTNYEFDSEGDTEEETAALEAEEDSDSYVPGEPDESEEFEDYEDDEDDGSNDDDEEEIF